MRDEAFSGDHATIMQCLEYTIEEYYKLGCTFETVALVYATSPCMDIDDLKKACDLFENSDKKRALLSITPLPIPITQSLRMDKEMGHYQQ